MKNKILYLLSVALFLSLQIAEGQQNAKPLKITSCKVVEMEVEVDLIKPTIITIVNNLQATSRKYKIVEGNGLITKIGKFDVVEYKDNKPVKIQVIVEDKKLGCDTAYVT